MTTLQHKSVGMSYSAGDLVYIVLLLIACTNASLLKSFTSETKVSLLRLTLESLSLSRNCIQELTNMLRNCGNKKDDGDTESDLEDMLYSNDESHLLGEDDYDESLDLVRVTLNTRIGYCCTEGTVVYQVIYMLTQVV